MPLHSAIRPITYNNPDHSQESEPCVLVRNLNLFAADKLIDLLNYFLMTDDFALTSRVTRFKEAINFTAALANLSCYYKQKQLGDMEGTVKEMQKELDALRKYRQNLNEQKNIEDLIREKLADSNYTKVSEVSKLREDYIRAKNTADEEAFRREKAESRMKEMEAKLEGLYNAGYIKDGKDGRRGNDSEITSLKNQIRDLKDELEETKLTVDEKNDQLQEYRGKYLQAQTQVEELKRQLDMVDMDNKQVSEQIQLEIHKMKMQFQEKLHELSPLPDLLKTAQMELQEAQQLQKLAENSSDQLSSELFRVKEKLITVVNCMNTEKVERAKLQDENQTLKASLEEKKSQLDDLTYTFDDNKCTVTRLEEKLSQQEERFKVKATECAVLLEELNELRQEANRSLARCKERTDTMKKFLQTQISELERQLVQSRAQYRTCQKERDEIRQRMQLQINNLQEGFELSEIRLRTLQGQKSADTMQLNVCYYLLWDKLAKKTDVSYKMSTATGGTVY